MWSPEKRLLKELEWISSLQRGRHGNPTEPSCSVISRPIPSTGGTARTYKEFRKPSYGSNGLLVEHDGSVLACEHESRSITRYSAGGVLDTIADSYQGKRFNSPNDLCKDSKGAIYFTDPPWGLAERNADPAKEIPFSGVFRYSKVR